MRGKQCQGRVCNSLHFLPCLPHCPFSELIWVARYSFSINTLACISPCLFTPSDRWQTSCSTFNAQLCFPHSPLGRPGHSTGFLMPQPGDPNPPRLSTEDAFLELLTDTLETMERSARGQFLERFFKSIAHVDLNETQSLDIWEQVLARKRELSESVGKKVVLQAALVEVLASANLIRLQ